MADVRSPLPPWLSHEPPAHVQRIRHVFVDMNGERLPGLMLSRHQVDGGWEGRVIVPAYDDVDRKWRPTEVRVPGASLRVADGR